MKLIPRHTVPDLDLPLVGGGRFSLANDAGARGSLLCFYRGLHCPICAVQLKELAESAADFKERGIVSVAISADPQDRAEAMAEKAPGVQIAYDFPLTAARDDWGLYISTSKGKTSIGIEEPALFHEPGLFLVNPDRTLYYLSIQTMPFARPKFPDLLGAVDFAIQKDYPARGQYTGDLNAATAAE